MVFGRRAVRRPSGSQRQNPGRLPGVFCVAGQRGFSLTELIVTIVIAGILLAVAVPRWQGETGFEARGFRDETITALRYAQKSAIAARRQVCIDFQSTGLTATIAPTYVDPCADPLRGPGTKDPLAVVARGSVQYVSNPGTDLRFDPMGRPVNGQAQIVVQGLPANLAITVEAETGYVH